MQRNIHQGDFFVDIANNIPTGKTPADSVESVEPKSGYWKKHSLQIVKKFILLLFSVVFSLYLAEMILSFFPTISSQNSMAILEYRTSSRGLPVDRRERWEAVTDLRNTGESWYPSVSPNVFMNGNFNVEGNAVVPLGGVINSNILYCNESGQYTTYTSDEYGFHNPVNVWHSEKLENVFIGDSFTNGSCVMPGEGFVDRIREIYPATVNMAATGNGPLRELAGIKEYLNDRKSGYVFWVYFEENDLADLHNEEAAEPILKRYLNEEGFTQGLIRNRDAINKQMISFIDRQLEAEKRKPRQPEDLTDRILLRSTKETLFRLKNSFIHPQPANYDLKLFGTVLSEAKKSIEPNGGELVFIYLPGHARYDGNKGSKSSAAHMKNEVIGMVNSLGIDVIDIDKAFSQLDDPRTVFTFSVHNHYNAGGNLIIAGEILRYLKKQSGTKP